MHLTGSLIVCLRDNINFFIYAPAQRRLLKTPIR